MGNTFTDENIPPTITTEKGVHTRQANGEHIIESEGRKQQEDQERQMRARPHEQNMGALQQQVCAYMTRAIGDVRVEEYRGKDDKSKKAGECTSGIYDDVVFHGVRNVETDTSHYHTSVSRLLG